MKSSTFIFFGIVGSGKGTQVKMLVERLKNEEDKGVLYVGTGEIFRKILESSEDNFDTQAVKEIMHAGKLMPDEITNKLVARELNKLSPDMHAVFDGYPRTVPQSEEFENMMKLHQRNEVKIIYIELSEAEAMKRNLLRGRHDDTEEGLKQRFAEYRNKVLPAMNYFNGKPGYTIHTINGKQSVEAVHKDIVATLNL